MRQALGRRLEHVFEATEEQNWATIVSVAEPRPGGRLLDLGCGDGAGTRRVADAARVGEIAGVETAPHLVAAARGRGIEIAESDLGQPLPFPDASFDVVMSNQVIEHLSDTDGFLRECRRVVKAGGYVIISTNNLASWHNIVSLTLGWQPMPSHVSDEVMTGNPASFQDGRVGADYPMHRRIFTARGLAGAARHHGLALEVDAAAGWYPLGPRAARVAARLDRRHAAFLVHRYTPV